MARKKNTARGVDWKACLKEDEGFLRALVEEVLQQILEGEMEEALGAAKGERTAERRGYRSGYYGRMLVTRVGKLELRVPQDRQGRFSTQLFERYQRSEKALVSALSEMYVQGVSTRKVDQRGHLNRMLRLALPFFVDATCCAQTLAQMRRHPELAVWVRRFMPPRTASSIL